MELELFEVGAFAADLIAVSPDPFPVGNEGFFRTNGMKLVRYVHVDLTRITGDAVWSEDQIGIGWVYYPPSSTDLTEAKLLTLGKESVRTHLATFGADAFQEYPGSSYRLDVDWFGDEETPVSYIPRFRYKARFTPIKGTDGTWQTPAEVIGNMKMEFGEYVFMELPGVQRIRVRWWDGKGFQDSDPNQGISLASIKKSSVDTSFISLPTEPIIGKLSGILTMAFWDDITESEVIARYQTGTGTMLPGKQEMREPLLVALGPTPGAIKIFASGDYSDISEILFERSGDLRTWTPIIGGGIDSDGKRILPPKTPEFFRAQYR